MRDAPPKSRRQDGRGPIDTFHVTQLHSDPPFPLASQVIRKASHCSALSQRSHPFPSVNFNLNISTRNVSRPTYTAGHDPASSCANTHLGSCGGCVGSSSEYAGSRGPIRAGPAGPSAKNSPCNAGHSSVVPRLGRPHMLCGN